MARKKEIHIPMEVVEAGEEAVTIYLLSKKKGTSDSLAIMFALRDAPACETDDTFMARHKIAEQVPNERQQAMIRRAAKRAGMPDDFAYFPTHAHYPGDPGAMCTHGETRAKLKKRRAEVEAKIGTIGDTPKHKLHPRIVNDTRKQMIRRDPALAQKDQRELVERIVDTHARKD